jgi:hypothetical protein
MYNSNSKNLYQKVSIHTMSKVIHDNLAQVGGAKDFTEIKLKIEYSNRKK